MRTKVVIFSLLFLNLINGIEHTVVLGSLSLIADSFDATERIGWFSVLYTLATLITTPIVGYLANHKPLKPLFRIGLYLLISGFFLCVMADSFIWLLIGRTIAGVGGGFLAILIPSFLGRTFPLHTRVKIDSYNFLVYSTGTFIGPVVGSLIVGVMDWRGIFLLSTLLFLVFYGCLEIGLKKDKAPTNPQKKDRFFIAQSILFSLFLLSIIVGIELVDEWSNFGGNVALWGASLLFLSGFLFFSKRSSTKLFHPSLIRTKLFAVLISYSFVFGVVKFVLINYLSIYILSVLGFSLFTSNLSLTVFLCANALGNFLVAKRIVHRPYKKLLLFSYLTAHLCFAYVVFGSIGSVWVLYLLIAGFGLANGFAGYPNMLILQQKNPEHMGSATASNTMARHFGGVLGVIAFQQFVIQTYGVSARGFDYGFGLVWLLFAVLGAGIFLLPMEKLDQKNKT